MKLSSICLYLAAAASLTYADGGSVQLQQQAGPFVITLFSEPSPIRVGHTDLTVLCQEASARQPVLNAQVMIHLRKPGGATSITEFVLFAKRSDGRNGVLYAAAADLPLAGRWPLRVSVRRGSDEATVSGALNVLPPQPAYVAYWPLFVALPLLALVFAINLRLRRGRALRHPRAQA